VIAIDLQRQLREAHMKEYIFSKIRAKFKQEFYSKGVLSLVTAEQEALID